MKLKLLHLIIIFFLLIGPTIFFLDTRLIFLFLLSTYYMSQLIKNNKSSKEIRFIVILIILSALYIFLVVSLNEFKDTMGIKIAIQTLLYYCSGKIIYQIFKKSYHLEWLEKFVLSCSIVFFINSLYVILVYFNHSFGDFAFQYLGGKKFEVNNDMMSFTNSKRSFDLGIGSGAIASLNFAIIFTVISILNLKYKKKFYSVTMILILIATSLLGRTGFYIELLILIIVICVVLIEKILSINKSILIKNSNLVSISLILIVFIISTKFISDLIDINSNFISNTLPWLFEFYYSYKQNGMFETDTTNTILNNMYFLPETTGHLLFGNSNLGRSDLMPYIPSDVGYVRIIFGFGILGASIIYLPLVYVIILSLKKIRNNKLISIVLISISIILISVNFKEMHLLFGNYSIIVFVLYFHLIDVSNYSLSEENK